MNKYIRLLVDPSYRFSVLASRGFYREMPDKDFVKKKFKLSMGYDLDLESPKTFNGKLQWLKLYNRKPIYTTMVDKYEVKKYVADIIGEEYIIPTLGVWERFEDIDFDSLPNQFVLKTTHDSGGVIVCKDKESFNKKKAKKKINRHLNRNYFYNSREWPYKDVKPRIIAEKFMQDRDYENLNVFKIFNFGGEPKIIQTIQNDKTKDETIDYFDTEWNLLDLRQNFPNSKNPLPKPETLPLMLELSKKLSGTNNPFLRTDFYEINGKVYFSEFTFFSDSGFANFHPEHWDEMLGNWIKINDGEKDENE